MSIRKLEIKKRPFLVSDLVASLLSGAFFGLLHAGAYVSGPCSSIYSPYYDIALVIVSLGVYLGLTCFIWWLHDIFPGWTSSGRINWIPISLLGLFLSSLVWGIMDVFQCRMPLTAALSRSLTGGLRISFILLPIFFVLFIFALVAAAVIRDETSRNRPRE